MQAFDKKILSERNICTKYIMPTIVQAGWDMDTQVREEVDCTKGQVLVRGRMTQHGEQKPADYVLYYKPNLRVAITILTT